MKKQYALNKLFNSCIILGIFLAYGSVVLLTEKEILWGLIMGLFASVSIVLPGIFTPYCYAFDSEGISFKYVFVPEERYLWNQISAIEVDYLTLGHKTGILDSLYAGVFSIKGNNVGTCRFYMNGNIRKSFRTKYLLKKYWDGKITGYPLEEVKNWIVKKKTKRQLEIKEHLKDEILPMEREVRADAREWLSPFISQAKQYDLEVKTKYLYITKDFEESRSRPNEDYTYTLLVEISHFGETNENRIVEVSVDLLHARLGKTAYRGVKNKFAKEELEFTLSDTLNEIYKNGIESYC